MVRQRLTARKKLLGPCLGTAALLAAACAEPQPQTSTCDAPDQLAHAESLLPDDPLGAIDALEGISDCDDKFALLYAAEVEIADRTDDGYYYHGEVRPRGWYDKEPSAFTKYVLAHVDRFESGGETAYVSANSFWLDQIQDRNHPVLGSAELAAIRDFDYWVWEDGDGSRFTEELLARYRSWLAGWLKHPKVPSVRARIAELEKPAA